MQPSLMEEARLADIEQSLEAAKLDVENAHALLRWLDLFFRDNKEAPDPLSKAGASLLLSEQPVRSRQPSLRA